MPRRPGPNSGSHTPTVTPPTSRESRTGCSRDPLPPSSQLETTAGDSTREACSPPRTTARPKSITPLPLSAWISRMGGTTGLFRTRGRSTGVRRDSFALLLRGDWVSPASTATLAKFSLIMHSHLLLRSPAVTSMRLRMLVAQTDAGRIRSAQVPALARLGAGAKATLAADWMDTTHSHLNA